MDGEPLNKRLLLGVTGACTLLTLVFIVIGFPYDRLGDRFVTTLERATGAHMEYTDFGPVFTWAGPALEWQGIVYRDKSGNQLDLDRARMRPGWSLYWFAGDPTAHVDLTGPAGRIVGIAIGGGEPGFEGRLEQIRLAQIPSEWLGPELRITGELSGDIDVRYRAGGLEGILLLEGREGNLAGDALSMDIPVDQFSARLSLGGDHRATIETLHLEGPLLRADVTGSVGASPTLSEAPLDLVAEIYADVELVRALELLGLDMLRPGTSTLGIGGTAGAPQVR